MRNLIRTPLTWLVVAEFVVVGTLIVLAWHAVAGAVTPVLASPILAPPADTGASPAAGSSLPSLPGAARHPRGAPPGLNVDPAFWRGRLAQLNQEQVFLEQLEWRIVHSAMTAMERYIDAVVIPSIQRAERGG